MPFEYSKRTGLKKKPAEAGQVEGLSGVVWNVAELGEVLMSGRAVATSVVPTATEAKRSAVGQQAEGARRILAVQAPVWRSPIRCRIKSSRSKTSSRASIVVTSASLVPSASPMSTLRRVNVRIHEGGGRPGRGLSGAPRASLHPGRKALNLRHRI